MGKGLYGAPLVKILSRILLKKARITSVSFHIFLSKCRKILHTYAKFRHIVLVSLNIIKKTNTLEVMPLYKQHLKFSCPLSVVRRSFNRRRIIGDA